MTHLLPLNRVLAGRMSQQTMWYSSPMTEVAPEFQKIHVPVHWAGMTRTLADGTRAWTCGGCLDVDACAVTGKCARASSEDFAYGNRVMRREGD